MKLSMIFMLMTTMTTMILMMMINSITKKSMINKEKLSPFECGFNPMSKKRMPFSIHFFLIATIFLIFDVEIIIILPMIMTMKMCILLNWLLTTTSFILVLTLGLYHEWVNGMLNWTK
uniref:NADH dehydrogenase subunit 3 n=1 Tax=Pediopsoides anchorides TaxID=3035251 RepID=UPI002410CBFF|nr:NADH dehydrogenase subunit 3 [Pediopsoides anchorides]WEP24777.1 NADH dehydrogenase subunit 3 [Pediopsoides anchorides]